MSVFSALSQATPPSAAIEVAANRVSAAVLQMRSGGPVVASHAAEALGDAVVVPSLTAVNVRDRAALGAALARVLDRLGSRPKRIGLVVPDPVAKISLIRFEQVPARTQELDQLVRWQVRKTTPFPIEEAQVSFVPGERSGQGQEFIVSVARRAVVEEYESVCLEAGLNPGLVDLASFSVINAALAQSPPTGDWLLLNIQADYASIAILRGEQLIFFRNRTADTDGDLVDLVHQAVMYYEDRLAGGGFARVVINGGAGSAQRSTGEIDETRRALQERSTRPVETLDPLGAAALSDRIGAAPELREAMAPLVGLLLRDRGVRA